MKRAVITGGTGAIGTAIIKNLIDKGVEVLVLCRKDSQRNSNIPESPLVKKAFCTLDEIAEFDADGYGSFDVFFHLAWAGTTGEARNDMYLQNLNVRYALDAVKLAKKFGCKKFVGAGSQAEYGYVKSKLTATTPAFPESGYGIGKLCAGLMTKRLAEKLGLEHNWVRVLSVFGENDGKNSLIMSLIERLKSGQTPKLTKGEQIWDYLYSADAAEAFRLVAEKGVSGRTYVLGSGSEVPLKDYIIKVRDIIAPEIEPEFGAIPYYENQAMYLSADISGISADTGWRPVTGFEEGIKRIIESL